MYWMLTFHLFPQPLAADFTFLPQGRKISYIRIRPV